MGAPEADEEEEAHELQALAIVSAKSSELVGLHLVPSSLPFALQHDDLGDVLGRTVEIAVAA